MYTIYKSLVQLVTSGLLSFILLQPVYAQQGLNLKDVSGFSDSRHHWMDITDHEQVIVPAKDQKSYNPSNVREIADNILLYQQHNGGWPKNYDMLAILTDDQKKTLTEHTDSNHTTFDNGATYTQIEYLAKAFTLLKDERYRQASLRGLSFILKAQYANGGWPQFYPDVSGYRKYITFNDGAMVGVMTVLQHINQNASYYSFIDDELRQQVKRSFEKGIDCILKCQVTEDGKLTVWCQQHDNITLKPTGARTFELASLASEESTQIVELLMNIQHPDAKVIAAVKGAVDWFRQVAIPGIRVKTVPAKEVVYKFHASNNDRVVVDDPSAPPIWTRYYELKTNRPFFADRDGKAVYKLSDVSRERRTGYGWYGYWPASIINSVYPKWLEHISK